MPLVPEISARINANGPAHQEAVVKRWRDAWLNPFMPERGWHQHSMDLVDADSLLSLSSLIAIFDSVEAPLVVQAEQSQALLDLLAQARIPCRVLVIYPRLFAPQF
jgi:hypothetical protein